VGEVLAGASHILLGHTLLGIPMGGAPTDIGLFSPAIVHTARATIVARKMTAIVVYRMIL
jgi:hypothetical protein